MYEENGLLIEFDLQFFAKDGEGGEKTEPATAKKLKDARDEGKVAKSKEASAGASLLVFFIILKAFTNWVGGRFMEIFRWMYSIIPDICDMSAHGLQQATVSQIVNMTVVDMLIILIPFLTGGLLIGLASNIVQVGWKVTAKPLQPKLSKFNPINGFKRMFSKESLFNLLMAIIKISMIFYITYISIKDQANSLFLLYDMALKQALSLIFQIIIDTGIKISVVYIVLGLIDYLYQRWKFSEDMKMTKQEVKDEYKNTEGDPQIKGQQRRRMMEASQRRMMDAVPQADVVITNPTHIAVAIKYDKDIDDAPRVLAKGEDYLAQKIKEKARESRVPIVENKPLARAIYATVDINEAIPPELYQAVAEILALVYTNQVS